MKSLSLNGKVVDAISGIFIILFVYTSVSKLRDYETFRIALRQSPLFQDYSTFISIALPTLELIIALLLIISRTRIVGLTLSTILMFAFTSYLAYMIFTKSDLPCNCGGVIKYLSWKHHLVLNIILFILSILAWILSRRITNVFIAINPSSTEASWNWQDKPNTCIKK